MCRVFTSFIHHSVTQYFHGTQALRAEAPNARTHGMSPYPYLNY